MRSNISAAAQPNWGMVKDSPPTQLHYCLSYFPRSLYLYFDLSMWDTGWKKELCTSAQNSYVWHVCPDPCSGSDQQSVSMDITKQRNSCFHACILAVHRDYVIYCESLCGGICHRQKRWLCVSPFGSSVLGLWFQLLSDSFSQFIIFLWEPKSSLQMQKQDAGNMWYGQ